MSYDEYLRKTCKEGCRESWIEWKIEVCGMRFMDAVRASYDPDWGYEG